MIQSLILILGMLAAYLVAIKNKWGQIVMLLQQPLWLYVTYTSSQFGMFLLSIFYTLMALYGIYIWFIKNK